MQLEIHWIGGTSEQPLCQVKGVSEAKVLVVEQVADNPVLRGHVVLGELRQKLTQVAPLGVWQHVRPGALAHHGEEYVGLQVKHTHAWHRIRQLVAVAQEVRSVVCQPEGCWFDPRAPPISKCPWARHLTLTAPDVLVVTLHGWHRRRWMNGWMWGNCKSTIWMQSIYNVRTEGRHHIINKA